jgi:hypothetical protein
MHISLALAQTRPDTPMVVQFVYFLYLENSGTAQKQRPIPLFSRSPNRWQPRISAENAMSLADNFVQKQQKQQKQLELSSGRPFCASCECVEPLDWRRHIGSKSAPRVKQSSFLDKSAVIGQFTKI